MGMIEIGPHDEIKKLYNTPANKRLKRWALAAIAVSILLMTVMLIWIDTIPHRTMLWMRGFAGLFALIFAIIYACLVYRVNRAYITRRR